MLMGNIPISQRDRWIAGSQISDQVNLLPFFLQNACCFSSILNTYLVGAYILLFPESICRIKFRANRVDKTGKRGSKIYHLEARMQGVSTNYKYSKSIRIMRKKRSIYQLLLYFHSFKRGELLTKTQLNKKMLKFGLRYEDLQEINNGHDRVTTLTGNTKYTQVNAFTNSIGNIGVVEYKDNESSRFVKNNTVYYLYILGFSVMEFITYIKKTKKVERTTSIFTLSTPCSIYLLQEFY